MWEKILSLLKRRKQKPYEWHTKTGNHLPVVNYSETVLVGKAG